MSKGRGRLPAIPDDKREEFLADYQSEGSARALAAKWGVSSVTALKSLRRFGADTSKPPVETRGRKRRSCYHPKLGQWSDAKVAKDLGVSSQAVSQARRARGIESPTARAMRIVSGEEG